jgi:hypothetical protein
MIIYPRKAFQYLFHIFLKVLLKYTISFIYYKALQSTNKMTLNKDIYFHAANKEHVCLCIDLA